MKSIMIKWIYFNGKEYSFLQSKTKSFHFLLYRFILFSRMMPGHGIDLT